MSVYHNLASFVKALSYEQLSCKTIEAAKRVLLDSIGCMVAGSTMLRFPTDTIQRHKTDLCTIVGVGGGYSREWATIMNGCNIVATEMDEGNQFAKGHPAAHFLPALFTEAEVKQISGQDFLVALIAGYEIAVSFGSKITLHKAIHPHGNWGTGSSSAVVAKVRGLSTDEIKEAIVLGSSLPVTSVWASALTGANVRNSYIGISNLIGLMTPDMVQVGIRSNQEVLLSIYGDALGNAFLADKLSDSIGREFMIEKNYLKTYACCRFVHGAVDCVIALKKQMELEGRSLKPDLIKAIKVETYGSASTLKDNRPLNALAAKFSIPFSLSILIYCGKVSQVEFTDACVDNVKLIEAAKKIKVEEDSELSKLLPEIRATRVTIEMIDGYKVIKEIHTTTGDYTNPLTKEQII